MTGLTRAYKISWLTPLWEAIWTYEDTFADTMDEDISNTIDDMKTAMAWIAEELGLEEKPDEKSD